MAFVGVIGAGRQGEADAWHGGGASDRRPGAATACPETECVRGLLPAHIIAAAERRAQGIGMGADRVLICADAITEEAYLEALAASLGTSYEKLDHAARADCPLDDDQLIQAAAAGLLPLHENGQIVWIVAPRCFTARRLAATPQQIPNLIRPFRLTSSERLWRFVARYTQRSLGRRATEGLHESQPLFSNAPQPPAWKSRIGAAIGISAAALLAIVPAAIMVIAGIFCAVFLGASLLRLSSVFYARKAQERTPRIPDSRLPIYTIICALYHEANVVGELAAAIRALNYPIEKLDVKFVLEADDDETRQALSKLDLGPPFEIITAPAVGPRTKPKALNVALPLARGVYTVVYDAEDTPEPDQLRRAVAAFKANDGRLACIQASLTIDNTADNCLARMFTANYAGQFDVFLPGLAALELPFPLGGSSNHFRTAALRRAGGWDPYNVTEDADLGIRLHRLGYRVAALPSATYEEAPARFVPWLKQRTRWYKGWMQTWLVHSRKPLRLIRELGPIGAAAFQLFLAGNVLAALIHPFAMGVLCYSLLAPPALPAAGALGHIGPAFSATLLAGYASNIVLDFVGLRRRGLTAHAWVLAFTPIHWFLLSLAAWRALLQLLSDPQRWEKTEHGVSTNSRFAEARRLKAAAIRRTRPAPRTVSPMSMMARTPIMPVRVERI